MVTSRAVCQIRNGSNKKNVAEMGRMGQRAAAANLSSQADGILFHWAVIGFPGYVW